MWFIGVEVEQETSAPPPKKNPGSAPGYCRFCRTPHEAIIGVSSHTQYPRSPLCCTLGCILSLFVSLGADDDGLLATLLPGSLQPNNFNVSNNMDTIHCPYCLTIHVNHVSSE